MLDKIALFLLIIGGLNWGSIGLFRFDIVAWIFGGQTAVVSRIVYTLVAAFLFGGSAAVFSRIIYVLVAISAIWCISLFFKNNELVEA